MSEQLRIVAFMMQPDFCDPYVSLHRDSQTDAHIEPLVRASEALDALAAKDARIAASEICSDRAYRNGLIAGFAYGINGDETGYHRSLHAYQAGIHEAVATQQKTDCPKEECPVTGAVRDVDPADLGATPSEDGRETLSDAERVAFVLRQIGSLDADDITGDDVDLRFEDANGRDTGCDISIVEYAEKAADLIDQHARILAAKDAEIARLTEENTNLRQWKNTVINARAKKALTVKPVLEIKQSALGCVDWISWPNEFPDGTKLYTSPYASGEDLSFRDAVVEVDRLRRLVASMNERDSTSAQPARQVGVDDRPSPEEGHDME